MLLCRCLSLCLLSPPHCVCSAAASAFHCAFTVPAPVVSALPLPPPFILPAPVVSAPAPMSMPSYSIFIDSIFTRGNASGPLGIVYCRVLPHSSHIPAELPPPAKKPVECRRMPQNPHPASPGLRQAAARRQPAASVAAHVPRSTSTRASPPMHSPSAVLVTQVLVLSPYCSGCSGCT